MNAITIHNSLPAVLVAISGDALAQIAALEAQAAGMTAVATLDDYKAADEVLAQAVRVLKDLEAERKRIKAPILDLGRQIDDAASEAVTGLTVVKARLGSLLLAFQQAENRRREEERQRLAEAARLAEAENARIAALNRDEMARVAALTEAVAPWDEVEVAPPAIIPTVEITGHYERQMAAAPLKSSAVVAKTIKRIEITDASLVPREFGGVPLWEINIKAVEKLAKAGAQIPGVTITEVQITASKG
jgi:hypothetical protein